MSNSAGIFVHKQRNYLLTELETEIGIKFSETDLKIVRAKSNGLSFSEMSDKEIRVAVDQIMLRGAAISGCPLPTTDFFAEIIGDELIVFLVDFGYARLTLAEVLLAMRINAKGGFKGVSFSADPISFYGHCFNVDYVSKILDTYNRYCLYFNRRIQNHIDGF
jgi:hypothetical protein